MSETQLRPEPWAFHLLGLLTPLLAISGNILGVIEDQVFVAMGVVFVWGVRISEWCEDIWLSVLRRQVRKIGRASCRERV